jgi:diguanylate cyclase (GGDEF)-like protein
MIEPHTAMLASNPAGYEPHIENRKSVLSLRWLLIILASYLTVFSYVGAPEFAFVFGFALVFAGTNLFLSLLPVEVYRSKSVQRALACADVVLVSTAFFLLRQPGTYFYIPFILIFVLAVVWRDLRVVLFAVFAVSVLYGLFTSFKLMLADLDPSIERFLTLALFFVVAIFYVFLSERLQLHANLSSVVLEENRRADVMVEITSSISTSLNSQEILHLIVTRLREVFDAKECSILRLDSKQRMVQVMVRSGEGQAPDKPIDIEGRPELLQAYNSRELIFLPEVTRDDVDQSVVAAPMLVQDSVLGLIYVSLDRNRKSLSEADERFFKVMSGTAANALRNAQMFEEMEHRARTDFLTGLPNHRFFQSTLSVELGRAQRNNHPLSLLIIDLDFLKEVNDRFGHPSGDMVIRSVAETIRNSCREFDFAARYGGEEFTVILPETPLSGAIQVADRIRERIASLVFTGIGTITASIGASNFPLNALGKEDLIRVADQALYVAKNNGRDRVAYFNYQLITK